MSDTFIGLRYPARGYFLLWCFAQAAVVGLLLGTIIVEPRLWWRNLLSIAVVLLFTWALYHAYRFTDRVFDRIDQRLRSPTGDTGRQT